MFNGTEFVGDGENVLEMGSGDVCTVEWTTATASWYV